MKPKLSDKEVVQKIARDEGLNHTNEFYREEAKRIYKREPSPSTVVKRIGPLSVRLRHNEKDLIRKGKIFLSQMSNSSGLAQYIIVKASAS